MLRLFICIWIPDHLKDKIIKFQQEILKLPIRAKPVEKENLHLTITFLGNKDERDLNTIIKKLDNTVIGVKKFSVKLTGLKIIPSESYIRVIGLNAADEENLSNLVKRIGKSVGGEYHERVKLTLCRVKSVKDKHLLREFIERNRNIEIGEFSVKNVSLVKSTLSRSGPIYETIHESMLE